MVESVGNMSCRQKYMFDGIDFNDSCKNHS